MKRLGAALLAVLLLLCACGGGDSGVNGEVKVVFADVGKADFILIKTESGFGVIDAGYKASKDKIDSVMKEYGVSELEFAVATHNDKDHIGSMAHVIQKYKVKTLYTTPLESEDKLYKNMLDAASLRGTEVKQIMQGAGFSLGDAVFSVLEPDSGLLALQSENDSSLVIRMQFGGTAVLFMGDAQLKTETALMKKYSTDLQCDAIKIGHHGSDKASSQLFLSKTGAEYAIITTGDEEPAAAVTVKAINACKMKKYDTQTDGDIVLVSNGKKVTVTSKGK